MCSKVTSLAKQLGQSNPHVHPLRPYVVLVQSDLQNLKTFLLFSGWTRIKITAFKLMWEKKLYEVYSNTTGRQVYCKLFVCKVIFTWRLIFETKVNMLKIKYKESFYLVQIKYQHQIKSFSVHQSLYSFW